MAGGEARTREAPSFSKVLGSRPRRKRAAEDVEKAGLRATPLAFEPGFCRQRADGVVEMTTDLSVFEVEAVAVE